MNKNFTKKIVSLASAAAIMGAVAVPAMAAAPVTGTTKVHYTNENIVGDGKWGVKIPSGVALSDNEKVREGKEYGIALVSMDPDHTDLRYHFKKLNVDGTVTSTNTFKFKNTDGTGEAVGDYTYKVGTVTSTKGQKTFNLPQLKHDDTAKTSYEGTFTLTNGVNKAGKYMDTLTFSFTADFELNNN